MERAAEGGRQPAGAGDQLDRRRPGAGDLGKHKTVPGNAAAAAPGKHKYQRVTQLAGDQPPQRRAASPRQLVRPVPRQPACRLRRRQPTGWRHSDPRSAVSHRVPARCQGSAGHTLALPSSVHRSQGGKARAEVPLVQAGVETVSSLLIAVRPVNNGRMALDGVLRTDQSESQGTCCLEQVEVPS